jgi:Putative peptidoglycan binding domain
MAQTPAPPATPPAAAAPAQNAKTTTTTSAKTKSAKPQTSAQTTTKRASTHKSGTAHGKKVAKKRGQQGIDSDRARDIQTALIREHYIQGEPSGTWDSATQAAMQRYQADHGWQAKTTPDARALIKLGLGPSHDHLLNPESAMTTTPAAGDPKAGTKQTPAAGLPQQ